MELRIDVQVSSTSSNHDIDFRRLTLYPNQNSASDVRDDIDNGVCYDCSISSEGTSIAYICIFKVSCIDEMFNKKQKSFVYI